MRHLRYTLRLLAKSPGFTLTAILILSFGIGANTAVFSLIDGVLLKPAPFPNPDRLVAIHMPVQNNDFMGFDYPDFVDISAAQRSFVSLAACCADAFDLTGNGKAERLKVVFASPSLFMLTRRPFVVGRPYTDTEDRPGGPMVVVLSERFWRSHFNADPKIIGTSITLSGQSFQVIGVAPVQMDDAGPPPTDLYVPVNVMPIYEYKLRQRDLHVFFCLGRLKDGVTPEQAQTDLQVIQSRLATEYPETDKDYSIRVIPYLDNLVFNYSGTIWLLGAVAGCLLLISSGNIANLLFARGLERRKEIMIRAALGASRRGLLTQLFLETIFLSLISGIVGAVFALWAIEAVKAESPQDLYRFKEIGVDPNVFLFVIGATLFTALLSGILPAWILSRTNIGPMLKDQAGRTGTAGPRPQQTQSTLIVAQIALACVLVIGAGLLVRSFQAAESVPPGFNPHHVLTVGIYPTSTKYTSDLARMHALFNQVLDRVRSLPGVTDAAMNRDLPFNWDYSEPDRFSIPGQPGTDPEREPTLDAQEISSDYFRTLQIPVLSGRDFNTSDTMGRPNVVIVDETLARRFFPGQDALGKQMEVARPWSGKNAWTIVGIVKKVQHSSPGHQQAPFQAYFAYAQRWVGFEALVVRTAGDPSALIPAVRNAVASVDPDIPVIDAKPYDELVAQKFVTRRLSSMLVSICSAVALLLCTIGIYGVLSYLGCPTNPRYRRPYRHRCSVDQHSRVGAPAGTDARLYRVSDRRDNRASASPLYRGDPLWCTY
jgi:putative ABC transport system permease protein